MGLAGNFFQLIHIGGVDGNGDGNGKSCFRHTQQVFVQFKVTAPSPEKIMFLFQPVQADLQMQAAYIQFGQRRQIFL